MFKVSIILSVHGNRITVAQTISSIVSQSFTDWELAICFYEIDEEVKDIIQGWRDRDSRISLHQVTKPGYVPPLNVGLEALKESTSEYICMIDSDDIMLPARLKKQVAFLEKRPDFVLVGGQRILIDQENNILLNKSGNYPISNFMIRRNIVVYPPIIHPSVLIRRSALYAIDGYREMFPHGTDSDLWMRLLQYGKFHNLFRAVIAYRLDNNRPVDMQRDQTWREILHISNCLKFRGEDENLTLLEQDPSRWILEAYSRMNAFQNVKRADRYFFAISKLHEYKPKFREIDLSMIYKLVKAVSWIRYRTRWRFLFPFNLATYFIYRVKWQKYLRQF